MVLGADGSSGESRGPSNTRGLAVVNDGHGHSSCRGEGGELAPDEDTELRRDEGPRGRHRLCNGLKDTRHMTGLQAGDGFPVK